MERAAPRALRRVASGILFGLGPHAEVREARVDASLERDVARANPVPQPLELPVATKPLELRMRVEHQRRPPEAACQPGALRMEAHDEKGFAGEAEREARVARIRAHGRIPTRRRVVTLVETLELTPEPALERALARGRPAREDGDEGGQTLSGGRRLVCEPGEVRRERVGHRNGTEDAVHPQVLVAGVQRGLRGEARETRVADEFTEGIPDAPLERRGRGGGRRRHTNMFRTQFGLN